MAIPMILALLLIQAPVLPPVEKRVMLTGFDRIRVDGAFDVVVTTGPGASARIVGDARGVEAVQVRVEGTTLVVSPVRDDRGRPARASAVPPVIEVGSPRVTGAALLGGGRVRIDRMAGPRVTLSLTGGGTIAVAAVDADQVAATVIGAGSMTVAGRTRSARFSINGPAAIDAGGLVADDLFVRSEGAGNGRYRARYGADVTGLGAGSIDVGGSPACRTRGTAAIRCGDGS